MTRKTAMALLHVNREMEGHRLPPQDKNGLYEVPFLTGLHRMWEEQTLQALLEVRSRKDWESVKLLCLPTRRTNTLMRAFDALYSM